MILIFVVIAEGKGPFDFNQSTQYSNYQQGNVQNTEDPFNFKVKTEQPELDILNITDVESSILEKQTKYAASTMGTERCHLEANNNINNKQSVGILSDTTQFSPCDSEYRDSASYVNLSSFKDAPTYCEKIEQDFEYLNSVAAFSDLLLSNTNSSLSSSNDPLYGFVNHNLGSRSGGFITPDDSNSDSEKDYKNRHLKLSIIGQPVDISCLSTPDVIRTITDIENENFNILDIVNDKVSLDLTLSGKSNVIFYFYLQPSVLKNIFFFVFCISFIIIVFNNFFFLHVFYMLMPYIFQFINSFHALWP